MNEVKEQVSTCQLPLAETHARFGATTTERDGWEVPASYGDKSAEYTAVRETGAGLIDLSSRGRILASGSEAVQFLNGLITNDMKTLREFSWMPAAFPNVQGRLIAAVRVIRLKDAELKNGRGANTDPTFMLDTEPSTHERVFKSIERFTLAGDFRVNDVTRETVQLSLQGKKAPEIIGAALGENAASLAPDGAAEIDFQAMKVTALRSSHTGEAGFDLIVDKEHGSSLWNALRNAGASPVGHDALDVLRIEAGIARFGIDMDESNVVSETNLDEAVSFTKGCYLGQEIIVRIKHRGHVAKKLTGLVFEQPGKVSAGAIIKSIDGKDIGRVTSATHSPRLARTIALGYVKFDYLTSGTNVKVTGDDGELAAQVTELPLVQGSWNRN